MKVIGYDLAVLGDAGLDSLEKWMPRDTSKTESIAKRRSVRITPQKIIRYYKLNGARVDSERRKNGAYK